MTSAWLRYLSQPAPWLTLVLLIIMFTNGPLSEAPSWMTVGGVVLGVVDWLLIYGRRMRIRQLWDEEAPTDAEGVLRALEKTSEWMR